MLVLGTIILRKKQVVARFSLVYSWSPRSCPNPSILRYSLNAFFSTSQYELRVDESVLSVLFTARNGAPIEERENDELFLTPSHASRAISVPAKSRIPGGVGSTPAGATVTARNSGLLSYFFAAFF